MFCHLRVSMRTVICGSLRGLDGRYPYVICDHLNWVFCRSKDSASSRRVFLRASCAAIHSTKNSLFFACFSLHSNRVGESLFGVPSLHKRCLTGLLLARSGGLLPCVCCLSTWLSPLVRQMGSPMRIAWRRQVGIPCVPCYATLRRRANGAASPPPRGATPRSRFTA